MSRSYHPVNHLVVGLPETGKTTFIAALWHAVKDPDSHGLKLIEFEGDTAYLDKIEEKWLRCEPVGRTEVSSSEEIVLKLEDEEIGFRCLLHLPDLSGETYREQFIERHWKRTHQIRVNQTDGVLLFIHPNSIIEPQLIEKLPILDSPTPEPELDSPLDISAGVVQWAPKLATTQVKLVDLLQFMQSHGLIRESLPVCIIISAWDVVVRTSMPTSPVEFLERRLPLLCQYLTSNAHLHPYHVFGISAQGDSYDENSEDLLNVIRPLDRIRVYENRDGTDTPITSDITTPIRWLIRATSKDLR